MIELKNKDGDVIPPRPSIYGYDSEFKKALITRSVENMFRSKGCPFEIDEEDDLIRALIDFWQEDIDEYQLAKKIESSRYKFKVNHEFIDKLEQVGFFIEREYRKRIELWFLVYQPVPPFEVGTKLIDGVITGICPRNKATYRVMPNGCTYEGTPRLLVKFEDAVEASDEHK